MNLLDLLVKIGVDDQASSKISDVASRTTSILGTAARGAGRVLGGIATVAASATGAALTGVASLGQAAVQGYADYEQLTGGISKLFGTAGQSLEEYAASTGQTTEEAKGDWLNLLSAQKDVFSNARNAYLTAGVDQNTYMEQVTGFSAALIQSLGGDTQEAARIADMAMSDMADNFNTFGTDMESIQGVYQNLAKDNYQLLDNLRLPYKGTKEGMEDLIAHANELREANGEMGDLTIESFADMIVAIHTVQEELNIAGTTQREAASTVSGSINMLKASWQNFVIELGGSGEMLDEAMSGLIESISAVVTNVLPVIESFVQNLTYALPQILPPILDTLVFIIGQIASIIPTLLPPLVDAIVQALQLIVDALPQILPPLIDAVVTIIIAICELLPSMTPALTDAAIQLFMALVQALPTILAALLSAIGQMLATIFSRIGGAAGEMAASAGRWFNGLLEGASQIIPNFLSWVASIPGNIINALGDLGSLLWNAGSSIMSGLLDGIMAGFGAVADFVGGIAGWIFENKGPLDYDARLLEPAGRAIMGGFNESLQEGFGDVQDTVNSIEDLFNVDAEINGGSKYSYASASKSVPVIEIKDCVFNVRDDHDIELIGYEIAAQVRRANDGRL